MQDRQTHDLPSDETGRARLCLAMGCSDWDALRGPLIAALPPLGLGLLVAGGLAYTGGIGFYAWKKLPYGHTIWHVFVLAGSACHVVAVFGYAVPGV